MKPQVGYAVVNRKGRITEHAAGNFRIYRTRKEAKAVSYPHLWETVRRIRLQVPKGEHE